MPVHATVQYENGYQLLRCSVLSCTNATDFYGVSGWISISPVTVPSGDTVAFWVSEDVYYQGTHYWVQTGYVLGLAPNNIVYSQPETYIEINDTSGYSFIPVGVASWNTPHLFKAWIGNQPQCCFFVGQIDSFRDSDALSTALSGAIAYQQASTVQSTFIEVHQTDLNNIVFGADGSWSSLQYYWLNCLSQWTWFDWGTAPCIIPSTSVRDYTGAPYCVINTSLNNFVAGYDYCGGGSGGGGRRA
jgi:hypothetical protein